MNWNKTFSFITAASLLVIPAPALASNLSTLTEIDVVSSQGNGVYHPDQIAIERTLNAGANGKIAERIHMTPIPAASPYGLAGVVGTTHVYVADHKDGSIYEMDPDSGKVYRHFSPQKQPSTNIQGLATGLGEDIYVYYNGDGTIQRLKKDGTVVDSFQAPTIYGHCLAYRNGYLYLMNDRGTVYQINAWSKEKTAEINLRKPDGSLFNENESFTLNWDGKYWNVANAQDKWKLYRYDENWNYHDQVDLNQWSIAGCVFDGSEYLALNNDNNRIFTIRVSDDTSGDMNQNVSDHYQYVGNVITTTKAHLDYPQYEDQNVMMMYNDSILYTAGSLKPYVAYLDASGNRKDSLFDTFVYSPTLSEAQQWFYQKSSPDKWAQYIQKTVADLKILDQAWADKNTDLHQQNQAKVYLAVPYPNLSDDLGSREKLIHDYIDSALSRVQAANLSHINFRGFYWYNEDADYHEALVVDFNQYVHADGLKTLWIPDSYAQEASDYPVLGFDEVYQQPNYYPFKDTLKDAPKFAANLNRFFNLAWTGIRYHKGVEIELDSILSVDPESKQRFQDYLKYGLVEGFLDAPKAWYDNYEIANLYQFHDSLYDTLYQVVKGSYAKSDVKVTTLTDGTLTSSSQISLPASSKIRLDVLSQQPFSIQKVVIHTDTLATAPTEYYGSIRVDEELAVKDGKLVKQEIGSSENEFRLGFNVPFDQAIDVQVLPARIHVTVNGAELQFDSDPVIINDRTLVPLRKIFETLGAAIQWDQDTQTVTAVKGNHIVKLQIGSDTANVNGNAMHLDVAPQLINDRTMVPTRFVSEVLGANVNWEDSSNTVQIQTRN